MQFVCRVICFLGLVALFQAMPAQGADKSNGHHAEEPVMKESLMKVEAMGGITLKIVGGEIQGGKKVIRVKQGDEVEINLMADQKTEIHLHGYDIEKTVSPGKVVVMAFQARVAGRFPVTLHGSHSHGKKKSGGHGEKVLFYLEVHP